MAINGKKKKNFNERAKLIIMFLPSTMGFERLQHTQNIHGGDDMRPSSHFTIHITNIKKNIR